MEPLSHKARPLAEELTARFKNNARFKYLQGVTYIRLGMDAEYRQVLKSLRNRARREESQKMASRYRDKGGFQGDNTRMHPPLANVVQIRLLYFNFCMFS